MNSVSAAAGKFERRSCRMDWSRLLRIYPSTLEPSAEFIFCTIEGLAGDGTHRSNVVRGRCSQGLRRICLESSTLGECGGDIGLLNIGTDISQCLNLGRCQGTFDSRTASAASGDLAATHSNFKAHGVHIWQYLLHWPPCIRKY